MSTSGLVVLLVCTFLLSVHGRFSFTNTPCTPRSARTCGEHRLVKEESVQLPESDTVGPNVCMVNRTYEVNTRAYVLANYCYRNGRCRTYCTVTRNCTGPARNVTYRKTSCCDGFAVNTEVSGVSGSSFFSFRKRSRNLKTGCTLMLRDSVTECLLEQGLDEFTLQLLTNSPDAANLLGDGNSMARFTVFGVNDGDVNSTNVLGHVVNKTVLGKKLRAGTVLRTQADNVFLHIARVNDKVFVNGAEVSQLDACQARNGIVHVVDSPIPLPTTTIAATLRGDPRFTEFLRLLDGGAVNITALLNERKSRTLLAPTNDAISKLPAGAVDCLLLEENHHYLSQLVLIHISAPAESTATLSQRSRLYTFNKRYYLFVQEENGEILLTRNRIPLEESDIFSNNGVIHVIPEVIVPPEVDFDKLNCPVPTTEAPTTDAIGTVGGPQVVGA